MPTNAEMERSDAIAAARQKIKLIREGILVPDDPRISFKRHFVREGDRGIKPGGDRFGLPVFVQHSMRSALSVFHPGRSNLFSFLPFHGVTDVNRKAERL